MRRVSDRGKVFPEIVHTPFEMLHGTILGEMVFDDHLLDIGARRGVEQVVEDPVFGSFNVHLDPLEPFRCLWGELVIGDLAQGLVTLHGEDAIFRVRDLPFSS